MRFSCHWVTGDEAAEAIGIRRRVYVEEFGFDLGPNGARDELDDRSHHLITRTQAGEPVASLRLVDSENRPFEIDRFLEVDQYLQASWNPAEITRLCILPNFRRITRASFVHLAMLEAVLRLISELGTSHIVASTRDDLLPVYRYLLFDTYAGVTYAHPEIGNSIHTLMILDIHSFPERCRTERPTLYPAVEAALGL